MQKNIAKSMLRRVKNPCPVKYSKVERVWAHLGFVHVQDKDGYLRTMEPREAAHIAKKLNEGLPDEPSSRKVVYQLIDDIIKAVREAQSQKETPQDANTAAVTKAVADCDMRMALTLDPKMVIKIRNAQLAYPMLNADEIRVVYTNENWSDKFKEDLLKAAQKERHYVWETQHILTPPIL